MKRLIVVSLVLLAVFVSILVVIFRRNEAELDNYRKFLESRYASEISLLEQRATELPHPDDRSEAAFMMRETITNELRVTLDKSEVFSASWSLDGHHGLKSLRSMETNDNGFSTYSGLIGSHDATQLHHLYYAKSFQGRALLVYEGWVPTGINKSYKIVFDRDAIARASQK